MSRLSKEDGKSESVIQEAEQPVGVIWGNYGADVRGSVDNWRRQETDSKAIKGLTP